MDDFEKKILKGLEAHAAKPMPQAEKWGPFVSVILSEVEETAKKMNLQPNHKRDQAVVEILWRESESKDPATISADAIATAFQTLEAEIDKTPKPNF